MLLFLLRDEQGIDIGLAVASHLWLVISTLQLIRFFILNTKFMVGVVSQTDDEQTC